MMGGMGGTMPKAGAGMPDMANMDPVQLERMAQEMGIDPNMLNQAAPKDITDDLPTDFKKLEKKTPQLPLFGKPRFPGLPGLGGSLNKKK